MGHWTKDDQVFVYLGRGAVDSLQPIAMSVS